MSTRTVNHSVYEWTCDACSKVVTFTGDDRPKEWLQGSLASARTGPAYPVLVCSRACFNEAVGVSA